MHSIRTARTALIFGLLSTTAMVIGCASTRVEKNPGPHDRGVRYYRPKPYLLVSPTATAGQVKIELDYLPDYSEEYSIHVRAGIGTNKTSITLDEGWNLKALNIEIDSKVNENIKAVGDLLKGIQPFTKPGAAPTEVTKDKTAAIQVTAYDVPLGYYESIVSRGQDGVKRLYGWRYVGFAPFAGCPLESTGVQCQPCDQLDLFGLVTVGDKLYFRRLSEIGTQQKTLVVEPVPPPTTTPPGTTPATPGTPGMPMPEKKP